MCGLRSEVIQKRLLAEENFTLKKAYEISHGMETANCQASELQVSAKSATTAMPSAARDAIQQVVQPQQPKPNSAGLLPPCYRCGKTGHSPDRCFFKTQKCRCCGKKGAHSQSVQIRRQVWSTRDSVTQCHQFQITSKETTGYVELSDSCVVPDDADILEDPHDLFAITEGEGTLEAAIMLEPEID